MVYLCLLHVSASLLKRKQKIKLEGKKGKLIISHGSCCPSPKPAQVVLFLFCHVTEDFKFQTMGKKVCFGQGVYTHHA